MEKDEKVNEKLELDSGKTDMELESTISDNIFGSEFGGFFPEEIIFIPKLD